MTSTVGDFLFQKLSEKGVTRLLGSGHASVFMGSIQRNHLAYADLQHSISRPRSGEVGAFVCHEDSISAYISQGRYYFPSGPAVYIVEQSSAQFRDTTSLAAQYGFSVAVSITSPTTAASQIGRALDTMMYYSKPVYIGISLAVAAQPLSTTWSYAASGTSSATPTSQASYSQTSSPPYFTAIAKPASASPQYDPTAAQAAESELSPDEVQNAANAGQSPDCPLVRFH
ncbi:hypothetical protein EJ04DRAFT_550633 [Polyplosphaeria fusca]|uniref:Uncharacterized protein n=1 Tax=Polyplosphaeria fusca TaxID=682080 RepID=A0A9P4V494_9PLEO|nr:hypothetical protein EJ04DRAFT_550633 [Polyplosphaeria fusca]